MNKLKRYTMGRVTLAKTENSSLQGAGIVECEELTTPLPEQPQPAPPQPAPQLVLF